jgi:hypothetical protein
MRHARQAVIQLIESLLVPEGHAKIGRIHLVNSGSAMVCKFDQSID